MSLGDQPRESSDRYDGLKGIGLVVLMLVGGSAIAFAAPIQAPPWAGTVFNVALALALVAATAVILRSAIAKRAQLEAEDYWNHGLSLSALVVVALFLAAWRADAAAWAFMAIGGLGGGLILIQNIRLSAKLVAQRANAGRWLEQGLYFIGQASWLIFVVMMPRAYDSPEAHIANLVFVTSLLAAGFLRDRREKHETSP